MAQEQKKGIFVMFDGLDGIGKGIGEEAILDYLREKKLKVFDQVKFERSSRSRPVYAEIEDFDEAHTCEPAYAGIGRDIREEVIARGNKRKYDARTTLIFYSLDRGINYKRNIIPLLEKGKHIIQARGLPSTVCYQRLQAEEEGKPFKNDKDLEEELLRHSGNQLAWQYPPNLLIIPTIKDVACLEERLKLRRKDDNSFLEEIEFQRKLKDSYESGYVQNLFLSVGTKVVYIDAGISIEATKKQAVEAAKPFFENILPIQ